MIIYKIYIRHLFLYIAYYIQSEAFKLRHLNILKRKHDLIS